MNNSWNLFNTLPLKRSPIPSPTQFLKISPKNKIVLFVVDFEAPGEDLAENVPLIDEMPMFSLLMTQHPMEMEMAKSGLRVRRGVSDECCHKGCTLAVLSSYCAE